MWRLVIDGIATIHEIETSPAWSLATVLDANEALDVSADADAIRKLERQQARQSRDAHATVRLDKPR